MSDEGWNAFSDRVAWQAAFHATCDACPRPDAAALALINDRNASVLVAVSALMDRRSDSVEDDSPLTQEVARLDAKLNVLMEIVNRLLLPQSGLPPRVPLRFNAAGAVLSWAALPPVGEPVLLKIHFDVCRALPLELPGLRLPGPVDGKGFVGFEGLSEAVRDGIERLVFRQHRRQVAEARALGRPAEGASEPM
ncbi:MULTISPECIES: PilZ domain-containing protein [Luteibacter]|uniref:PilZ domain-containing protein n=1 Tax=Luteibacter flocculans TaxID=2780091 RepID=A0ABY4T0K8_9GAMM|nr:MULTISPECIES: PilZ domain-containing protein [Luteibacter]URL57612.1 PilZ domain-containing protein [Luteibacter flocculans]SFW37282.1 Atypical PilZ domain-containing protein, cyclic di-GMP receptor [Luteibacter sp. UNCMF366Tsu5.1]